MNNKYNIRPESAAWLTEDDYSIAGYFNGLGFTTLKDVLDMRVFDLMNMNTINAIRVEEIITCLYKFLNPNTAEDEAMYYGMMGQHFDYTAWRKIHKNLSEITVSDLVLTEGINLRAIQHFYDAIRKSFFKSDEYNWREYRYRDYQEYLKCAAMRGKEEVHAAEV